MVLLLFNTITNQLKSDLTSPARFRYAFKIRVLLQYGVSGCVPVPPEKRFLIKNQYN